MRSGRPRGVKSVEEEKLKKTQQTFKKQWSDSANNALTVFATPAAARKPGHDERLDGKESWGNSAWTEGLPTWTCPESSPPVFTARTHLVHASHTHTHTHSPCVPKCSWFKVPAHWHHHWSKSIYIHRTFLAYTLQIPPPKQWIFHYSPPFAAMRACAENTVSVCASTCPNDFTASCSHIKLVCLNAAGPRCTLGWSSHSQLQRDKPH